MRKILDEMFMRCTRLNEEMDTLFENKEVKNYNFQIANRFNEFATKIKDKELQKQFKEMCIELEEVNTMRDVELSRLFVVHGMALFLKLQNEILDNSHNITG